ncbi:MAG TPA: FAD-dependent oxidoreductase, partial [Chitinophagaceae bacterium]|nr:FAD-dependent oxidoreductase [Chitinophagaceae bacterium]
TGVELAGAIAELRKNVLPRDYPELPIREMKVYLVESGTRLLAGMSPGSSAKALEGLRSLGVDVILGISVKAYDGISLTLSDGRTILTRSLIWSAGVRAMPVRGLPEDTLQRNGRVQVNSFNQVEGEARIFAIGDIAHRTDDPRFAKGYPMVAQVAIQQGRLAGRNIIRMQQGKPLLTFRYRDKGTMSTIGRNRAVAEIAGLKFSGLTAWMVWMGTHLVFLMGFRNKLIVFMNWIYRYITFDRGSRIIFRRGPANLEKLRQSVEDD